MNSPTLIFPAFCTLRAWQFAVLVLVLVVGISGMAVGQTSLPAYYSTNSNTFISAQPVAQASVNGTVSNGINAADGNLTNYATLKTDATLSIDNNVALRLKLTGVAPAGYRAGMVIANASVPLSLSALGTVTLRTYLTGATPELREQKVVSADVVRASLGISGLPTQLEFVSSQAFDAVEIVIGGALNVNYTLRVYNAYGVRPGIQTRASGYLSRFASLTGSEYSTSTTQGLLCVNSDIENPSQVADYDLSNFALLHSTATVLCNPALRTKLAGVPTGGVPAGYYAGFVIGQASTLDVGVLSGLKLTTYLNGVPVESRSGIGALELTLLPDNKAQVSFAAGSNFDAVKIERIGVLTALDDLAVYYGFGLAPAAFQGINPVLSDFAAPVATVNYSASAPQVVSVGTTVGLPPFEVTTYANVTLSNVDNPQFAADANTDNYAQLNTTGLGLLTNMATASLQLALNGSGKAGNRVGMVVDAGAGLLDLNALQRLTISTFDANKDIIESKTGADLLNVSLLGGSTNRNKLSFLASRDFKYVQLTVNSAASVLSNTRVYYAFAEDVPLLSLLAPLPVELTAFTGRWANGAAELSWATASERNSSHFVVERSAGGESGFQAVGRVAARGNSTSPQAYKLRDAEAGTQGAALLYYRLRQVDVDGQEAFSPVITVAVRGRAATAPQLELYPNPAPDAQAVQLHFLNLPAAGGTVQTYSELGQLVSQLAVMAGTSDMPLPALAPGLYHVVLRDAAGQKLTTQRLLVQGSR